MSILDTLGNPIPVATTATPQPDTVVIQTSVVSSSQPVVQTQVLSEQDALNTIHARSDAFKAFCASALEYGVNNCDPSNINSIKAQLASNYQNSQILQNTNKVLADNGLQTLDATNHPQLALNFAKAMNDSSALDSFNNIIKLPVNLNVDNVNGFANIFQKEINDSQFAKNLALKSVTFNNLFKASDAQKAADTIEQHAISHEVLSTLVDNAPTLQGVDSRTAIIYANEIKQNATIVDIVGAHVARKGLIDKAKDIVHKLEDGTDKFIHNVLGVPQHQYDKDLNSYVYEECHKLHNTPETLSLHNFCKSLCSNVGDDVVNWPDCQVVATPVVTIADIHQ